jgi:ABC-2 type transport system permease protein
MKNIGIILAKELRSYFNSPVAYIFIIIFLLLSGTYFISNVFLQNLSSMSALFETSPFLLLFFAPAITMRLVSEEKKTGTFEILGTKAIKTGEIIVGKFLAAWLLVFGALLPTLIFVVTIASLGSIDIGPMVGGYIGLLLLGGAFIAIGILGSSLSQSQIVAFIISFSIILVLFVIDRVLIYLPVGALAFIEYLGVNHHFTSLARGVLDSRDIVYYLSLIIITLLGATILTDRESGQTFLKLREFSWRQQIPRFILVLGLLILVILFSFRIYKRVDLTSNKIYTLSDATKNLLDRLDDNFFVNAYFSAELPPPYHNHRRAVQELLDEYRAYSHGKVHYKFTNPLHDPQTESEALQQGIKPVQVKVLKRDQFQTAKAYVGLAFSYEDKHERIPVIPSLEQLEYSITSSLKKMLARQVHKLGILTGQNEPGIEKMKALQDALTKHYEVFGVDVAALKSGSQDIDALLIIAPQRRFTEEEKFIIDQYVMHGGKIGFWINTVTADALAQKAYPLDLNLDDMYDNYGWIINPDLIADARCVRSVVKDNSGATSSQAEILYPLFPIAADFNPHLSIAKNLAPVAFSYVSSIDSRLASIRGVNAEVVVTSSTKSQRLQDDQFDIALTQNFQPESFTEQHIPLAVTVEGSFKSLYAKGHDKFLEEIESNNKDTLHILLKSPITRMVAVGDGDFVLDGSLHGQENISFATNLVDWLVKDINLASIRSRDVTPKPLNEVSDGTKTFVKYFNMAAPSGVVILAGIVRLAMRAARRKRHKQSI